MKTSYHSYTNVLNRRHIRQGDIVYVDLGKGASYEQEGIRPCVVLQNNIGNARSTTTIVAALSSKIKFDKFGHLQPTHHILDITKQIGLHKPSIILFEQIRTISKSRILDNRPVGHINLVELSKILFNNFVFPSSHNSTLEYRQGDIVYVDLGKGIGSEQSGKAVCLIIQNNKGNKYSPVTMIVPLARFAGKRMPTHLHIDSTGGLRMKDPTIAMFEQMRTISKSRIIGKLPGHVSLKQMLPYIETALGLTYASTKMENCEMAY